jgi:type I restriction enzyme S subunit
MTQWPIVRLGDVMRSTELRDPTRSAAEEFVYVDISSVDNRSKSIVGAKRMLGKEAPSRARKVIRRDDVLVSMVRPNLNAVALVPSELDMEICSTGFAVLRPSEKISSRFLFAFVRSPIFIDQLLSKIKGANYPAVSESDVKGVHVPLPPLTKQVQVVNLLDEADAMRKLRAEANRRVANLIPALFSEMFGDPTTNSRNLPVSEFGSLCKVVGGGTPSKKQPAYWTGKIPWVSPKDMSDDEVHDSKDHISEHAIKESATNLIPTGSILVVTRSGILKHTLPVAINSVPVTINQDIKAFVPAGGCESTFLAAQLRVLAPAILDTVRVGATVQNLETDALKRLSMLWPPLSLQKEFAARVSKLRELEAGQAASRQRLDDLFQSMLHRAFNEGL